MLQVLFLNIISPCLSWLGSELRGRSSGQSPKEYWNTSTRYLFLTVTGQIHGELAYPIQVCFESICVRVIVIFKILMPMKCNLYEWMNVILDLKAIGNFFKNQFSVGLIRTYSWCHDDWGKLRGSWAKKWLLWGWFLTQSCGKTFITLCSDSLPLIQK